MKMIQEWLGHSDFSTTANIYSHLDYASKVSSAEAMLNGLGMGSNPENAPKKVWFLSRTGRFLSCYEIVKLKNSAFCIKKRYRALKKRAVPLIGGASEIWTLAALQTPYRISSATPSTSWVMLPIVIPQNLLWKKERKVGENSKYLIVENGAFLTMGR